MPTSHPQKVWFITGASRGFGLRIAEAALAQGDLVVATARRVEPLQAHFGPRDNLLVTALDVTDEAQAVQAVAQALARFGRIDVLVNNAGYGLVGAIEESSDEEARRLYSTNVFGLLNVTRAALPSMRERRSGHVINISSLGGFQSFAGFGLYCSTKFAVEGITEALHAELAPLGLHATAVEPGYFRTDFLDATSLSQSPRTIGDYAATAGQSRQAVGHINQQQPGDPAKLAQAVLQLVRAPQPPLRLPLGKDTLQTLRAKHAFVEQELVAWEAVAASTDFDGAVAVGV